MTCSTPDSGQVCHRNALFTRSKRLSEGPFLRLGSWYRWINPSLNSIPLWVIFWYPYRALVRMHVCKSCRFSTVDKPFFIAAIGWLSSLRTNLPVWVRGMRLIRSACCSNLLELIISLWLQVGILCEASKVGLPLIQLCAWWPTVRRSNDASSSEEWKEERDENRRPDKWPIFRLKSVQMETSWVFLKRAIGRCERIRQISGWFLRLAWAFHAYILLHANCA